MPGSISHNSLTIRPCLDLFSSLKLLVACEGCETQGRQHQKNKNWDYIKFDMSLAINPHYYMQILDIWLLNTFQAYVKNNLENLQNVISRFGES